MKPVGIVPLGDIPNEVLSIISSSIEEYFCLPSKMLPSLALPLYARDDKRCQYNAAKILTRFESDLPGSCCKTLAITYADLFIPIFTHVMGEARIGGDIAVISLFRLTKIIDGNVHQRIVSRRAAKIALHELGHLFTLPHCPDEKCLMHFSGTPEELDTMDFNFCAYCSTFINDAMKRSCR